MNWISIKEKFPKEQGSYLCIDITPDSDGFGYALPFIADFKKEWVQDLWGKNKITKETGFYIFNYDVRDMVIVNVTHWMSLPKLPMSL